MKIVSWNVNGIRSSWNHGVANLLQKGEADIYMLQETRTDERFMDAELNGYSAYWSFCDYRKGYSGTLILTKYKPMNVRYNLGDDTFDTEGRVITLEFDKFYIVNCYVPNSQRSEYRHDYRVEWDEKLYRYLVSLERMKPIIIGGDFNVPMADIDIYAENQHAEWNKDGFQSVERDNLIRLTESGFIDSFRYKYPDEPDRYTWWSNRLNKRKQNRGWRLDYFFVSEQLKRKITESSILADVYGSDHCPILLDADIEISADTVEKVRKKNKYTYADLIKMEQERIPFGDLKQYDLTDLWNSIDWNAAEEHLRKMQEALAKSAYMKESGHIEKWQKNIAYSLDAKLLAVRYVCSNAGGAGVDMIKWTTPHEKMSAALSLTSKGYRAMPSRLLIVKTKNGKQRGIHIETYYDRAMQTLYAFTLDPVAESWGDRKSFAFRKGRSSYDVNEYVKMAFSGEDAPEWAFIGDIRKYYDSISHEWIEQHIPMAKKVLNEFLNAGYVFASELYPMDEGIGTGCTLSPIIANMVLDGMQEYIYARLYPKGNIDYANGNLIRYADDVIISARDEKTARRIRMYLREFLEVRGLEMSYEKSYIVNVNDGFTFMSRTYKKVNGLFTVTPSEKSIERFMTNMRETIENHNGSQEKLIESVNKKIDGWTTYHKVTDADEVFRKMDVYISALLLELCEKKHPKWTREKILEKYWYTDINNCPRYTLPNKREVRVKLLSETLLVSYIPVKTNVNPYIDIEYLEKRTHDRSISNVIGVYRAIWERQEGRCYYCCRRILKDEPKMLVEVNPQAAKMVRRMGYVHERCLNGTLEYVDTNVAPSSINDVMELLEQLYTKHKTTSVRYLPLSEFFRDCKKKSVTLTFKEIEKIIGGELGAKAYNRTFWYRTGLNMISQCWLDNGYEIARLHLEDRPRVVFHITAENSDKGSVVIPDVIKYQRIPNSAKYEIENFMNHIIEKYGL